MSKFGHSVKHLVTTFVAAFILALLIWFGSLAPALADGDISDELRGGFSTVHEVWGNLVGFGQFDYRYNPDLQYQAYQVVWPGVIYAPKDWFQLSGGLNTLYTDNQEKADTLELRPFGGAKILLPNKFKWHIYNYTRYEFVNTENEQTDNWTAYSRIRSRFGVEIPLACPDDAWKPKTFYLISDVEPYYRFAPDQFSQLYVRGGLGYIINHRLRFEFIYYAEFSRPNTGSSLQYSENIFQLNLKIDLGHGILERLHNPSTGD